MDKLTVQGDATLTPIGDVILVLPKENADTLVVTASGRLLLDEEATLKVYTPGNVRVAGAGTANPSDPRNVQIWGTAAEDKNQLISLQGSEVMSAIVLSIPKISSAGFSSVVTL